MAFSKVQKFISTVFNATQEMWKDFEIKRKYENSVLIG